MDDEPETCQLDCLKTVSVVSPAFQAAFFLFINIRSVVFAMAYPDREKQDETVKHPVWC